MSTEEPHGAAQPPPWDDIAARADRVKELVTERFRNVQLTARAKAWEQAEKALADALGVDPEVVSWSSMIPMVVASAAIADRVMSGALGADEGVDVARRQELLTMFGVAEEFARVQLEADRVADDVDAWAANTGKEEVTMTAPAVGRCDDQSPHGGHTVGETYCPGRS